LGGTRQAVTLDNVDITLVGVRDEFTEDQLAAALAESNEVHIHVPMPSLGSAGEHLSIAEDFGDALYVGELMVSYDHQVSMAVKYDPPRYRTSVVFSLRPDRPHELAREILKIAIWFDGEDDIDDESVRGEIRDHICELTDGLPFREVHFPELADSYVLNLVNWMSYDLIDEEDPSDWEKHRPGQPECRFGYIRSAESYRLGGTCFSSPDAWVLQDTVRLADFVSQFGADSEGARTLLPGSALYDTHGPLISNSRFTVRPSTALFEDCTGMLLATGRATTIEPVSHLLSADGTALFTHIPGWTVVDFGASTRLLDQQQLEAALTSSEQSTEALRACLGRPTDVLCDWASITDDAFESLCWDVLHDCGQYDRSSLKKFGVSRSRDGGRDIEAALRATPGRIPRRFIFQCKRITSGRSLAGTAISVSDVIDQYGADGFGVMTCTTVDATLHDKLDGIAGSKRSPFFQIVNATAAILRAKVRRAIGRSIPLASKF
jgi:hypothetical protein